ncbi:MAG: hypothetical protein ACXVRJ_01465 [Gaiellaceae bacterium]
MYSFHRIKTAAATLMVGFLLAIAFTATAQAGGSTTQGLTAQQLKAVQARAQAMDRHYHLGAFSPAALAQQADERRAQAMDRYYNLGGSTLTAQQLKADRARAQATDRFYHLGSYAVIESSSPFQWPDAGIGAGAMLGTILVAGGLAVTLRRRVGGRPSVPRST